MVAVVEPTAVEIAHFGSGGGEVQSGAADVVITPAQDAGVARRIPACAAPNAVILQVAGVVTRVRSEVAAEGDHPSAADGRVLEIDKPSLPVSASPSLPPASPRLPAELAALDEQFKKLTADRVTAPFEAEVAKLNTSYLGGLDRKRAEEKAAGHLDSVLAIEAEKKLIPAGPVSTVGPVSDRASPNPSSLSWAAAPIPSAEDDATSTTTPAVLKGLRQIYREAYAKLEATRAANLKALTDPLTTRLKTLESDLTKRDRIADAKTVKEYREALGRADGPPSAASGLTGTTPAKAALGGPSALPAAALRSATKDKPFTNSLGMKFVPVPGTDALFCIHETRYKDYAAYATEAPGARVGWMNQTQDGFALTERTGEHPVIHVSWEEAQKFCAWLGTTEGMTYRLPTDQEWSIAVGIGRDEKWKKDTTPATVFKNQTDFPWGEKWPPPKGSGNFTDQSRKAKAPIPTAGYLDGYDDGYPTTAPVMSFKPNKLGLYDLSGNVMEWVEDWFDVAKEMRVLRGGGWYFGSRENMLSSCRESRPPFGNGNYIGFRIVLDLKAPAAKAAVAPAAPPIVPPPAPATAARSDFTNSLGMKFVKVPGTKVMFCIHETRRQDYAVYAAEVPGVDVGWKNAKSNGIACGDQDDHPVVLVNWDEAQSFSAWLGRKEGRTYRLPSDEEWSIAVGLGYKEKRPKGTTPDLLNGKETTEFPWGEDFPPKTKDKAGNYGDSVWHEKLPAQRWMEDYTDGFATTAPVMSFRPNRFGLYDMGGNVWEWCEDWWNATQKERVARGSCFYNSDRGLLLSSSRAHPAPEYRTADCGFRIVVEMTAP